MTTIATLTIEMAANIARLQSDMDQAKRLVGDTMQQLQRAADMAKAAFVAFTGVASVGAFAGMVRGAIDAAAGLNDLALKTGATVEALSAFGSVGRLSDTSLETIGAAMNRLSKNMTETTEESRGTARALQALGIDFDAFSAMSPDERMLAVAQAMGQFADGGEKSAAAMALFGKQGADLLPFLGDLAAAGELQAKVTAEQAAMADNFGDNLTRLQASGDAWKRELSMGMLPALNDAAQAFLDVMNGSGGLREQLRALVADGTITQWTRMAVNGLTYVLDAATYVWRTLETVGHTIAAVAAAAVAVADGDFRRAASIMDDLGNNLGDVWSEETLGQKLRARMDELQAVGDRAEQSKPKLDFSNVHAKNAEGANKEAQAYQKTIASIQAKVSAMEAEAASGEKLTEMQQLALGVMNQLQSGQLKLTDAHKREVAALLESAIATERDATAKKKLQEAQIAVAQHSQKLADAQWQQVEALRQGNVTLIEQNDKLRMGENAFVAHQAATLRDQAATLEWQAATEGGNAALEEQARLLRERARLLEGGAAIKEAQRARDEWQKTAQSIESSLTDALMRGFESGKGIFQALRDTAVNMFKTLVIRPIIQAVVSPAAGAVTGALGFSGAANAAGGSGGALGTASNALSLYNNLGALGAASGLSYGTNFLSQQSLMLAAQDAGLSTTAMASVGKFGPSIATLGAGIVGNFVGGLISGGYQVIGGKYGGTLGTAGGTIAGAAIGAKIGSIGGPLGAIIGGAVGGLVNRAFGRTLKDQGIEGTFGAGDGFEGHSYQFYKGGWFRSDKTKTSALDPQVDRMLTDTFNEVKDSTKKMADALGLNADQIDGFTQKVKISTKGLSEEEVTQKLAEQFGSLRGGMIALYADALAPLQKEGETLVQTFDRLMVVQQFREAINPLGGIFSAIAGASIQAQENLIALAGGVENFLKQANDFVSSYYSQAEQAGIAASGLVDKLQQVGIDLVGMGIDTKSEFRALVESIDVSTQQGQEQLAALLQVAPQFAQLADYMTQSNATIQALIDSAPKVEMLEALIDPQQSTATNTESIANGVQQSNGLLSAIGGKLDGILAVAQSAVAAAQAAAGAASAAAAAAGQAANSAALTASQPTYTVDVGRVA